MKSHGPWKIKKRTIKYANPWSKVYEDQVVRPDGKKGVHVFIALKPGVSVLPLDRKGFVYLTREFHYGVGRETIETVSGGVDKGETFLEAAKRELREELGIVAEEFIDLGLSDQLTTYVQSPSQIYLARRLQFVPKQGDGTETIELYKVPLETAVQMVLQSEITHSVSCVLILKAAHYVEK